MSLFYPTPCSTSRSSFPKHDSSTPAHPVLNPSSQYSYSQIPRLLKYQVLALSVQWGTHNSPLALVFTQRFILVPTLFLTHKTRSVLFIPSGFTVESNLVNSAVMSKLLNLDCSLGQLLQFSTWRKEWSRLGAVKKKFITLTLIKRLEQPGSAVQ